MGADKESALWVKSLDKHALLDDKLKAESYGLVESGSNDPKFLGTLTHRLWTCPVLQTFREANCPGWILRLVNDDLSGSFCLPSDKILLYTRALHQSVEPRLVGKLTHNTFNWIVHPEEGGVPLGRVYADGSRLFGEHRYFNLLARHGWAFAIVDHDGKVRAAASGAVPSWITGIYGAELWALLQAALSSSPGSPMHVDCNAVRLGAQKGRSWALAACRKLARAWIPLANVIEDNTDLVTWLPAHCGKTAIGSRVLSNGRLFDEVDHVTNDLVDKWAKSEARASAPCKVDFEVVNDATRLVEDLARWIGLCTREANHYPAPGCVERTTYIRDTSARKKLIRPSLLPKTGEQVKRKAPSARGIVFVPTVPDLLDQGGVHAVRDDVNCRPHVRDSFSQAKRPRLSSKQG